MYRDASLWSPLAYWRGKPSKQKFLTYVTKIWQFEWNLPKLSRTWQTEPDWSQYFIDIVFNRMTAVGDSSRIERPGMRPSEVPWHIGGESLAHSSFLPCFVFSVRLCQLSWKHGGSVLLARLRLLIPLYWYITTVRFYTIFLAMYTPQDTRRDLVRTGVMRYGNLKIWDPIYCSLF